MCVPCVFFNRVVRILHSRLMATYLIVYTEHGVDHSVHGSQELRNASRTLPVRRSQHRKMGNDTQKARNGIARRGTASGE